MTTVALLTSAAAFVPSSSTGSVVDGDRIACNGCKLGLEGTSDSVVVSFGTSLWHVDCFRCAKCQSLVEHDTNLLLLSDGSPVCENCSYICSVCEKPISHEAIVTGDESYHAECFCCRSCNNKIEELIFAKTSQGIWCMACHNERVARSRKHAESKRSRGLKKEKELSRVIGASLSSSSLTSPAGSSSNDLLVRSGRGDKEREREQAIGGNGSTPPPRESETFPRSVSATEPIHHFSTSAADNTTPQRQEGRVHLPSQQQTFPTSASASTFDSPHYTPSFPSPDRDRPFALDSRSTPPPILTPTISLNSFAQPLPSGGIVDNPFPSPRAMQGYSPRDSGSSTRPVTSPATGPRSRIIENEGRSGSPLSSAAPPSSVPSLTSFDIRHKPLPLSLSSSPGQASKTASVGSLSAPSSVSKATNRRSGFYGPTSTAAVEGSDKLSIDMNSDHLPTAESPVDVFGRNEALARTESNVTVNPSSNETYGPDLHGSVSFYDPDTILFLDHVSSGSMPSLDSALSLRSKVESRRTDNLSSDRIEQLDTAMFDERNVYRSSDGDGSFHGLAPNDVDDSDELDSLDGDLISRIEASNDPDRLVRQRERQRVAARAVATSSINSSPKSEISRKVRESIRQSRGDGSDRGMTLNVDLVEMLLSELDSTKNEMSDLQSKYSAFRRASRTAFEGFSMARDEYDREVAARREAEKKMEQLRFRFTEQALKLAAIDQEQKATEAFQRRSKELRLSVVGMEKQLSELKAEVELSTAQVEELSISDNVENTNRLHSSTRQDIAHSLSRRLDLVKDDYRREIEALIQEKDDLVLEVNELRQSRALFIEETTALSRQHTALTSENEEATRRLEVTKEAISRLRTFPNSDLSSNNNGNNYQRSVYSNQHTALPPPPPSANASSRLPFASRSPAPLSTPPDLEHAFEPMSVAKKFKWGKGKAVEPLAYAANGRGGSGSSPVAYGTLVPGSIGTSGNGAPRSSGSMESSGPASRIHFFQQTSILRPVKCDYCGDKMWGLNEVRCGICGSYTHAKCSAYMTTPCSIRAASVVQDDAAGLGGNPNGHVMFGSDLTVQAYSEGRTVPIVVTKCIAAVEAYGMNYEGIYRKSGGNGQTKLITQHFERGLDFDLQDLDKFNDLAAVTSCMKNFFRSLPDPLFTHDLHERFVACTEVSDLEARLIALESTLYELPEVHFYTAQALMAHLHRIYLRNAENKMTSANIGVVLGPTLLRSRDLSRELSDMGFKAKIVECIVVHQPRLFAKPFGN